MKIELCKSSVLMVFYAFFGFGSVLQCFFCSFYRLQHPPLFTAISRKVVGKSACDNPEGIVGGFECTVL